MNRKLTRSLIIGLLVGSVTIGLGTAAAAEMTNHEQATSTTVADNGGDALVPAVFNGQRGNGICDGSGPKGNGKGLRDGSGPKGNGRGLRDGSGPRNDGNGVCDGSGPKGPNGNGVCDGSGPKGPRGK